MRKKIIEFLFILSAISFTFIMNFSTCLSKSQFILSTIISCLVSFGFSIYLIKKDIINNFFYNKNKNIFLISLIITMLFIVNVVNNKESIYLLNSFFKSNIKQNLFLILILIFSSFFVCISLYKILNILIRFFKCELKIVTKSEKKFFLISFVVLSFVSVIWYNTIPEEAIKDDLLFSMDSNFVANSMFPNVIWHLDLRHIFYSILSFPFYSFFMIFNKLLPLTVFNYYIYIVMIQIVLLLLVAIMLKRILNDEKIMYFYLFSFPVLLNSIIIEKFSLCVFWVVLFVYICLKKKEEKKLKDLSLICATGSLFTSVFMGVFSSRKKGLKKIREWIILILKFLLIIIVIGKLNILYNIFDLINPCSFISIKRRFYGVTEMLASCIVAPLTEFKNGMFLWANEANSINLLGLFIFLICIYVFIKHRNDKFVKICFYWFCFSLFLFIGMNWYVFEAPLFNLYFSWSIVGMVFLFLKDISERLKFKNYFWYICYFIILIINCGLLIRIYNFFLQF